MTYNGYTNYETWLVQLWFSNDESCLLHWEEQAERAVRDSIDPAGSLARDMEEGVRDLMAESNLEGLLADLLSSAVSEVNWTEIANHYVEGVHAEV